MVTNALVSSKTALLRTIATIIVKAINADANKDGAVKTDELLMIGMFILQLGMQIPGEVTSFIDLIKSIKSDTLAQELKDFAKMQLLPDEFAKVETKIDAVTVYLAQLVEGSVGIYNTFKKETV